MRSGQGEIKKKWFIVIVLCMVLSERSLGMKPRNFLARNINIKQVFLFSKPDFWLQS
jgi:hypothetical protein